MIKASSVQTPTSSQNLPHEAFFPTVYTDQRCWYRSDQSFAPRRSGTL